jgi:hypothetical protein
MRDTSQLPTYQASSPRPRSFTPNPAPWLSAIVGTSRGSTPKAVYAASFGRRTCTCNPLG